LTAGVRRFNFRKSLSCIAVNYRVVSCGSRIVKLIKQTTLTLTTNGVEKIYEVDLCESAPGRFLVNFRHGRRGATMQEGTRTVTGVPQEQAQRLFDNLVNRKVREGYLLPGQPPPASQAPASQPPTPQPPASSPPGATAGHHPPPPQVELTGGDASGQTPPAGTPPAGSSPADQRRAAVLHRISQGHVPPSRSIHTWKLSRAVWRAGELGIVEACRTLPTLVDTGDEQLNYSICFTLGRLGDESHNDLLRSLQTNTRQPFMVRRMAAEAARSIAARTSSEALQAVVNQYIKHLPRDLRQLAENGPSTEFLAQLEELLQGGRPRDFAVLAAVYFIDNEHTRPALLKLLEKAPVERNYFQQFRYIFKGAEFRQDAQVYGVLARRFEMSPATWRAFRPRTKVFLQRRVWWTLNRSGEAADVNYTRMAAGVLLAYTDEDARPRIETRYSYNYRSRSHSTQRVHWDDFGYTWAFNKILYGKSKRYVESRAGRGFYCSTDSKYIPGQAAPAEREESYGKLWEQTPEVLLHLIERSRCRQVHEFATKVLASLKEFCQRFDLPVLQMLLGAPYTVTAEFGFELARQRYNALSPDIALVQAVLNCGYLLGRNAARSWVEANPSPFVADSEFIASLAFSPHADTRLFVVKLLHTPPVGQQSQAIVARCIARMLALEPDAADAEPLNNAIAASASQFLREKFSAEISRLGEEVIADLLAHPLPQVQIFASEVVSIHQRFAASPPPGVIRALLSATTAEVRLAGVKVVNGLPDATLTSSVELLGTLVMHQQPEIREAIRPTINRLAASDPAFGRKMADELIKQLLIPGAPDGAPTFASQVLQTDLAANLLHVTAATTSKLLKSRSDPAQEVGGLLLQRNTDARDFTLEEIVKFGSHKILTVRQASWSMFAASIDRVRLEMPVAVRLTDARWDDTRAFAFDFFTNKLTAEELTPTVLVSICDSVRPDVQQFGRNLITRHFAEPAGPEYLMKLSEHPSQSLQQFASSFLDVYVAGNPQRLQELQPYLTTVLSQVNRGRVAKERALLLLEREAATSQQAARVAAEILTRISATCAVGDKSRAIEILCNIRTLHPDLDSPLTVEPVEVRGGI